MRLFEGLGLGAALVASLGVAGELVAPSAPTNVDFRVIGSVDTMDVVEVSWTPLLTSITGYHIRLIPGGDVLPPTPGDANNYACTTCWHNRLAPRTKDTLNVRMHPKDSIPVRAIVRAFDGTGIGPFGQSSVKYLTRCPCGSVPPPPPGGTTTLPTLLMVVPDALTPLAGFSHPFYAILRDSTGAVTAGIRATWTSSDTMTAVVDISGVATFRKSGPVMVTARVGTLQATASINVAGVSYGVPTRVNFFGTMQTVFPGPLTLMFPDSLGRRAAHANCTVFAP